MLFLLLELSISRIYRKPHEYVHQPWPKQSDLFDRVSSKKRNPFVISDHTDPFLKPKDEVTVPFVPKRKTRPAKNRPDFEACYYIDGHEYTCIKMPWEVYNP